MLCKNASYPRSGRDGVERERAARYPMRQILLWACAKRSPASAPKPAKANIARRRSRLFPLCTKSTPAASRPQGARCLRVPGIDQLDATAFIAGEVARGKRRPRDERNGRNLRVELRDRLTRALALERDPRIRTGCVGAEGKNATCKFLIEYRFRGRFECSAPLAYVQPFNPVEDFGLRNAGDV